MKKSSLIISLLASLMASAQSFTAKQYKEDFEFFWKTVNENYCYFDKKQSDWSRIKKFYTPQIDTVSSRQSFVATIEKVLYELYDHHCGLNTNNDLSRRLVPTSADMWAEYIDGKPVIIEVRKSFGAEKTGVAAGMEVIAINDIPVDKAIMPFQPHNKNIEAKNFALRLALAGDHITKRKITLQGKAGTKDYYPDADNMMLEHITYPSKVESKFLGGIGYIKVNNYLFDNSMIMAFDSTLNQYLQTKALIIDLRETPSGGNTAVARAILGRFINEEQFYQKHELWYEERETGIKRSWEEIATPRGPIYNNPLVILADHWTGSIAEGITIAFDGMKRATVIGTELARLNGAIDGAEMPNTKIRFNFPTERLYHINGQPRELYKPTIEVDVTKQSTGNDVILARALAYLRDKVK
jgi:C-terminal processing protease CtpA/Prc